MRTDIYDFSQRQIDLDSQKNLKLNMGENDALSEYIILALRVFSRCIKLLPCCLRNKVVNFLAVKFKVNIRGDVDLEKYDYIYLLYFPKQRALLQTFVEDFVAEMQDLLDPSFSVTDNNEYNKLMQALGNRNVYPAIPAWIIKVLDYYRQVRNGLAHSHNDNVESYYNQIPLIDVKQAYPEFKGSLNPSLELTMDDYYLYSVAIKHFAKLCVLSLNNKVQWNRLGTIHSQLRRNLIFIDQDHQKKYVQKLIENRYSYSLSPSELNDIISDMSSNVYYKYDIPHFSMCLQTAFVDRTGHVEKEEKIEGNRNLIWLVPCDEKIYDLQNCINSFREIFVSQYMNLAINNIVFMYSSNNCRIKHKFKIIGIDINYSSVMDRELSAYHDNADFNKAKVHDRYCQLQYLCTTTSRELDKTHLNANGLIGNVKGCINLMLPSNAKLYNYINSQF